jgi:hypothetical protein
MKWLGALTASECSTALAKQRAFFGDTGTYLPANVSINHLGICEHYDDFGEKTDEVTATTVPPPNAGSGSGAYNVAAGCWINWKTGRFIAGRAVVGRTYLVPLYQAAFQNDGSLASAFITSLTTAGQNLITGFPSMVIYYDRTDKKGTRFQGTTNVTGVDVKDRAGVLRSRRG